MKKIRLLTLALAMLLLLAMPAFAFTARRSAQSLSVNGKTVACEKYNIDGSNYFKLRDLAALLNGTGSQFNVGYDPENRLVSITTNTPYTQPNGTELQVGEDRSGSAVRSSQSIMIDGVIRNDLSVYNIGGSNFFQLRQMGEVLRFDVDYISETNTAVVTSRTQERAPTWQLVSGKKHYGGLFESRDTEFSFSYDSDGHLITIDEIGVSDDEHVQTQMKYDEEGRVIERTIIKSYVDPDLGPIAYTQSAIRYEYDPEGRIIKEIEGSSEHKSAYDEHGNLTYYSYNAYNETKYENTYDALDRLSSVKYSNKYGTYIMTYLYDGEGRLQRTECLSPQNNTQVTEYVYDGKGRLSEVTEDATEVFYLTKTTYSYYDDGTLRSERINYPRGPYGEYYRLKAYDEHGNLIEEIEQGGTVFEQRALYEYALVE